MAIINFDKVHHHKIRIGLYWSIEPGILFNDTHTDFLITLNVGQTYQPSVIY
jgi:hypothetical protein